jgi:hypothetical protein
MSFTAWKRYFQCGKILRKKSEHHSAISARHRSLNSHFPMNNTHKS